MYRVGRSLLELVKDVERGKDECFVGLYDLSVHDHLIKNVVSLLDVVHDVQFAHIFEVFVHRFHQVVDELQVSHLVLLLQVETHDEIQAGIAAVNHFVPAILDEGTKRLISRQTLTHQLPLQRRPLLYSHFVVVLGQSCLALLVHHQQELYHPIITLAVSSSITQHRISSNCWLNHLSTALLIFCVLCAPFYMEKWHRRYEGVIIFENIASTYNCLIVNERATNRQYVLGAVLQHNAAQPRGANGAD